MEEFSKVVINYSLIFVFIAVILAAIRMIKKAKEIEKDLEDSKILITEDELKNPRFLYDIVQSIVYIIFGIIIMWFAINGVKLDPNMVFSLITLSFATIFIILGSKGFYYEISAQISLKNNYRG